MPLLEQQGTPSAGALRTLTPRAALAVLGTYFAWQIGSRILVSPGAELDEAEQLILTQSLAWGYGSQAPLYTWLQHFVFAVLQPSVAGLAVLKNLILMSTYLCVYASARLASGSHAAGVAAAVSLLFLPQFAWESQRDLTHSVLAAMFSALTLLLLLWIRRRPRWWLFLLFGVAAGLGVQSKYNYVLLLASLLAAGLTVPGFRKALLDPRMILAVGSMLLLITPHALWVMDNPELAGGGAHKLSPDRQEAWMNLAWSGLVNLALSSLLLAVPLLLVFGWVAWKRPVVPEPAGDPEVRQLLGRMLLIALGLAALAALAGWITNFKPRWFQPVAVGLPVFLVVALAPRLGRAQLERLQWCGLAVAVVVAVLMPGHLWLATVRGQPFRLNAPFPELAAQLPPGAAAGGIIVAENRWVGGNMRLNFPRARILVPEVRGVPLRSVSRILIVWDATKRAEPRASLLRFAAQLTGTNATHSSPAFVKAPFRYYPRESMRLGYAVVESARAGP